MKITGAWKSGLCVPSTTSCSKPLPRACPSRSRAALPSWVTLTVFPNALDAAMPRTRLEAEGIPTFLDGERMGTLGMYAVATRGVKLQVPANRVADARIILSQSWSLPADEIADFEDLL